MVNIIKGDLFETDAKVICHQVNCQGVMGSGVALTVKKKYPKVFEEYKKFCDESPCVPLGSVLFVKIASSDLVIANLFAQDTYGYDGKCYTVYNALRTCLEQVAKNTSIKYTIAMPYLMGCCRGGGDWSYVLPMIEEIFVNHSVILYKKD